MTKLVRDRHGHEGADRCSTSVPQRNAAQQRADGCKHQTQNLSARFAPFAPGNGKDQHDGMGMEVEPQDLLRKDMRAFQ